MSTTVKTPVFAIPMFIVPAHPHHHPIELVSTEGMPKEEWLKWRRKGIGGSDVAAAMGISRWKTTYELYQEKCGISPVIDEENNEAAKEIGTALEDTVRLLFERKTGLKTKKVKVMYRHPLYPWMQADLDAVVELEDGRRGILEIKTSHPGKKGEWSNDGVPYEYELQVRHYLAVLDMDFCFIACLFLGEYEPIIRFISRDLDAEAEIIRAERHFWCDFVLARIEPPFAETERGDLALDAVRRYYGNADLKEPPVTLPSDFVPQLNKVLELRRQKSDLDTQSRKLDNEIKLAYAPIAKLLGRSCVGECTDGTKTYSITYNPSYRVGIPTSSLEELAKSHPDAYERYVVTSESRLFKVKEKKGA